MGGRANANAANVSVGETCFDSETPKVGMLLSVYDDRIVIRKREFAFDEDLGADWEFPWPIARGKPYDYEARARGAVAPEFPKSAKLVRTDDGDAITISFPTVRIANAGIRALDYEVTAFAQEEDVERIVDQRRVYSRGIGLAEHRDTVPVTICYSRAKLGVGEVAKIRFEVRPCDAWGHKGRPLS